MDEEGRRGLPRGSQRGRNRGDRITKELRVGDTSGADAGRATETTSMTLTQRGTMNHRRTLGQSGSNRVYPTRISQDHGRSRRELTMLVSTFVIRTVTREATSTLIGPHGDRGEFLSGGIEDLDGSRLGGIISSEAAILESQVHREVVLRAMEGQRLEGSATTRGWRRRDSRQRIRSSHRGNTRR